MATNAACTTPVPQAEAEAEAVGRALLTACTAPMPQAEAEAVGRALRTAGTARTPQEEAGVVIRAVPTSERGRPIFIQQDNARTHVNVDDPVFLAATQADGWDIRLVCQPPNSPDLNILDLGFFAALQSLFQKLFPGSIDDIIMKVCQAFEQYPAERCNRIFLTLQSCMRKVLKDKGGQHYKVPHMRKQVLQDRRILPVTLPCDRSIVDQARAFLLE